MPIIIYNIFSCHLLCKYLSLRDLTKKLQDLTKKLRRFIWKNHK